MFEVLILIPVTDNDGDEFVDAAFELFAEVVMARFGDFTLHPGHAAGGWVDAGRIYRDRTRLYGIVVRSIGQGALVIEIVEFAKRHFRQEAIFIRYLGVVEIL